jgi:acyl-CoA dehydrogenase
MLCVLYHPVDLTMDSANPVAETATRILHRYCDPQEVNRAADDAWTPAAWSALEQAGLTLAWVPEQLGGAGGGVADGFGILRIAGRHAAPLPIAETLLAGWLLARAGIAAPKGAMTCAPTRAEDKVTLATNGTLSGRLRAVPFAKAAGHLALIAARETDSGDVVALVDLHGVRTGGGTSIAGDALNPVVLDRVRPLAIGPVPDRIDAQTLLMMGAAARAMQMSGALEAILDLSVSYANERIAFERPIAKFQAVQHSLARLAGEVAAAVTAAGSAAEAIASAESFGDEVALEVAAAKIRVGEAAGEGAAIAHQVHGAIGFTKEHVLHRFTQRLWAWRDDFGNESAWAVRLGNFVAGRGADGLWPLLAGR